MLYQTNTQQSYSHESTFMSPVKNSIVSNVEDGVIDNVVYVYNPITRMWEEQ